MAKLPYKITICPDQPNPKPLTANHPSLVKAMMYSNDLTINQNQHIWPAARTGVTAINNHKDKEKNT
jgi:hypothetical protein